MPGRFSWARLGRAALQFGVILAAVVLHEVFRGMADRGSQVANVHGFEVVDVERQWWLLHEASVQQIVLPWPDLVHFLNLCYSNLHPTGPLVFLAVVYFVRPARFALLRNVYLLILATALPVYYLFPLAPPRLLQGTPIVDTLVVYGGASPEPTGNPLLVNPFAAMPSEHVAFALFVGIGLALVWRRPLAYVLGAAYWLLMVLVVVGTGNHWILDALAGSLVTVMAFLAVSRLMAWRARAGAAPGEPLPAGVQDAHAPAGGPGE